jgi:hypothetical protein
VAAQRPGSPSYRPGQSWPRTQFPDGSGSVALPPAEAYVWVSEVVARRTGGSAQARIVEMVPTPPLTQNARAPYLLAEQLTQGRRDRSFALVNTALLGNRYWQYYMTLVTAPVEIFPQALPLRTEVWQSWSKEINALFETFPGRYRVVPSDQLK